MHNKYIRRGASVGFILSICLWFFYFGSEWFSFSLISFFFNKIYFLLAQISIFGWWSLIGPWPEAFGYIFPSISLTLYGAIIGWFYGRNKNI